MIEKCQTWATLDPKKYKGFKASAGWLPATLSRHKLRKVIIRGEADDMTAVDRSRIMKPWKEKFEAAIEKYNVLPSAIYNADQTGLFYQKLPNTIYAEDCRKNEYAGAKHMKDKIQLKFMFCTAVSGKMPTGYCG